MSFYHWIREVKRLHQEGRSLPVVPLVEFAFSLDEDSLCKQQRIRSASIKFDCARTHRELEMAGIASPALDDGILQKTIATMFARDADFQCGEFRGNSKSMQIGIQLEN
jgi:hypothetical protein